MMLQKQFGALVLVIALMATTSLNAQEPVNDAIPLSNSNSANYSVKPMTLAQQAARYEADQRMMRLEWNKWIGYSPLRPTVNASYMSNGVQRFYLPSRGIIVNNYNARVWYW